ncbi:MAG TPA: NAD(P)H-dependent oxidoreductase [Acidimicrobiales bacterium]|nr:NAD(P)H-dependent oxidoreductase [Acidimicrobiales bacterium]
MSGLGIVVGNPRPRSRTLSAAREVAAAAAGAVGLAATPVVEVDLASLGPRLFDWSAADVRAAVEQVAGTRLLVVASPTFKASYTGLLKSFLDWFGTTGLSGVTVVPVMVGAGAAHALAVEVHLRPVLVEIGATVPTRGLYVTEDRLGDLAPVIDDWLVAAAPLLRASVGAA